MSFYSEFPQSENDDRGQNEVPGWRNLSSLYHPLWTELKTLTEVDGLSGAKGQMGLQFFDESLKWLSMRREDPFLRKLGRYGKLFNQMNCAVLPVDTISVDEAEPLETFAGTFVNVKFTVVDNISLNFLLVSAMLSPRQADLESAVNQLGYLKSLTEDAVLPGRFTTEDVLKRLNEAYAQNATSFLPLIMAAEDGIDATRQRDDYLYDANTASIAYLADIVQAVTGQLIVHRYGSSEITQESREKVVHHAHLARAHFLKLALERGAITGEWLLEEELQRMRELENQDIRNIVKLPLVCTLEEQQNPLDN